jgi:hypothetical protein
MSLLSLYMHAPVVIANGPSGKKWCKRRAETAELSFLVVANDGLMGAVANVPLIAYMSV